MKVGFSFVEEAFPHAGEVRGVTKDIIANPNLKKEATTSLSNLYDQEDIKEIEKTSNKSNLDTQEITNPIVMFIRYVIIKNTTK